MSRFSGMWSPEGKRDRQSWSSRLQTHWWISVLFLVAGKAMPSGSSHWKSLGKRLFLQPLTLYPEEDVNLTPGVVLEAERLGGDWSDSSKGMLDFHTHHRKAAKKGGLGNNSLCLCTNSTYIVSCIGCSAWHRIHTCCTTGWMKSYGRKVMVLDYRWRNRGTERLSDLLKVTCLIRGKAKLQWGATLVVEGGRKEGGSKGGNKLSDTTWGTEKSSTNKWLSGKDDI